MDISPEIIEKIERLKAKFASSGQDMNAYLEGLLYSDYLNYWDYIHLDTLLDLQKPKTKFPDEVIFIIYHQITELYFKMSLHALFQITNAEKVDKAFFLKQILRVNDYFENLIRSFHIMVEGMDKEQFLKFRMALLPASGFQSAQYRVIEIIATDAINLVHLAQRQSLKNDENIEKIYEKFYWKQGGIELATNKKTLTLQHFEEKYTEEFLKLIDEYQQKNIWKKYLQLPEEERQDEQLINALRQFDLNVEVRWPLMHYKSAVKYLQMDPEDIKATGGTNWQKYLPPRFQHIFLFPELLKEEEKLEWGKQSFGVK